MVSSEFCSRKYYGELITTGHGTSNDVNDLKYLRDLIPALTDTLTYRHQISTSLKNDFQIGYSSGFICFTTLNLTVLNQLSCLIYRINQTVHKTF